MQIAYLLDSLRNIETQQQFPNRVRSELIDKVLKIAVLVVVVANDKLNRLKFVSIVDVFGDLLQ